MAIAPKSVIFMRRYEDTDLPWDFLAILYKMEAFMKMYLIFVYASKYWVKLSGNSRSKHLGKSWSKRLVIGQVMLRSSSGGGPIQAHAPIHAHPQFSQRFVIFHGKDVYHIIDNYQIDHIHL